MIARITPVHASSDKRMAHAQTTRLSVAVFDDWRYIAAFLPQATGAWMVAPSAAKWCPVRRLENPLTRIVWGFALNGLEDAGEEPPRQGHQHEDPCRRDAGGQGDEQRHKRTARVGRARLVDVFCLRRRGSGGGLNQRIACSVERPHPKNARASPGFGNYRQTPAGTPAYPRLQGASPVPGHSPGRQAFPGWSRLAWRVRAASGLPCANGERRAEPPHREGRRIPAALRDGRPPAARVPGGAARGERLRGPAGEVAGGDPQGKQNRPKLRVVSGDD
jgi:hypothetical protein